MAANFIFSSRHLLIAFSRPLSISGHHWTNGNKTLTTLTWCQKRIRFINNRLVNNVKYYGPQRYISTKDITVLDEKSYDKLAEETLHELLNYFEELGDTGKLCNEDYDVQYESGVLSIHLGSEKGTYVINKQTPNRQLWLSSPISGPKRYDIINGKWTYLHDAISLHDFLSKELSQSLNINIDLTKLNYATIPS